MVSGACLHRHLFAPEYGYQGRGSPRSPAHGFTAHFCHSELGDISGSRQRLRVTCAWSASLCRPLGWQRSHLSSDVCFDCRSSRPRLHGWVGLPGSAANRWCITKRSTRGSTCYHCRRASAGRGEQIGLKFATRAGATSLAALRAMPASQLPGRTGRQSTTLTSLQLIRPHGSSRAEMDPHLDRCLFRDQVGGRSR